MSLTDLLVELEAAKDSKKAGPMEAYMRHQFLVVQRLQDQLLLQLLHKRLAKERS